MATRAVYLIGPPGVGKTTALNGVIAALGLTKLLPERLHKQLWAEPLADEEGVQRGLLLGKSRDGFGGTDALGMASHPDAVEWAENGEEIAVGPALIPLILGEGARLTTEKFLTALHRASDLTVIWLVADDSVLDERCEARGSNQKPSFRKGAATRAFNTARACHKAGVKVVRINTAEATPEMVVEAIVRRLNT